MMLREHDVVALLRDLPDKGLAAGDVGAIVHQYGGGDSFEVDVVDAAGHPKGTYTLSSDDLLRLNLDALLTGG